jgi:hypothetical protein
MQWTNAVLWDSLWCPWGVSLLSDSQGLRDLPKGIRGIDVLGVRRYRCSSNNSMCRLIEEWIAKNYKSPSKPEAIGLLIYLFMTVPSRRIFQGPIGTFQHRSRMDRSGPWRLGPSSGHVSHHVTRWSGEPAPWAAPPTSFCLVRSKGNTHRDILINCLKSLSNPYTLLYTLLGYKPDSELAQRCRPIVILISRISKCV